MADVVCCRQVPTHAALRAQHLLAHRARELDVRVRRARVLAQLRLRRELLGAQITRETPGGLAVDRLRVEAQALLRLERLVALVTRVREGAALPMHRLLVVFDASGRSEASLALVATVGGQLFAVHLILVVDFAAF